MVVLYRSPAMTVADPAYRAAVTRSLAALPHGRVTAAQTYWSTGSARFVSANRHETYAVLQLAGSSDEARTTSYDAIKGDLNAPGLHTLVGGNVPTYESINNEVKADIGRAEAFSMPVLLILLLVIFGSLTSALLPLAVGGTAIIGSFAVLRLLTLGTAVSTYSINITTILGVGLGIDYGLFMVAGSARSCGGSRRSRTRSRGPSPPRAGPSRSPGSRSRWPCPASCCSPRCSCGRWATAGSRPCWWTCLPR